MSKPNLWYTRRGRQIRGPYPAGQISRYILLGRIVDSDELSVDQIKWRPLSDFPDLIPEELRLDLSAPENRERLRIARLREDERQYGDRRREREQAPDEPDEIRYKRSGEERRESEPIEILRHREMKTRFRRSLWETKKENYIVRLMMLFLVLTSLVWLAFLYTRPGTIVVNNCGSPGQPGVNWNNCRMDGVVLPNANLVGAAIQNATLISADLRGAKLIDAQLSYTSFVNAQLQEAKLQNANLMGAIMRNANLSNAVFEGANLRFAIMQGANLNGANLRNADLTHVDLSAADITNADFIGAILDKAIWVDNTVCAPQSVGQCIPIKNP